MILGLRLRGIYNHPLSSHGYGTTLCLVFNNNEINKKTLHFVDSTRNMMCIFEAKRLLINSLCHL